MRLDCGGVLVDGSVATVIYWRRVHGAVKVDTRPKATPAARACRDPHSGSSMRSSWIGCTIQHRKALKGVTMRV